MTDSIFGTARLAVRLDAVRENHRRFREICAPASVAAVVKADAYGLGAAQVSQVLERTGCDTFFVARLEEGVALRPLIPAARIFVLDGALEGTAAALISHCLTPVLNSLAEIESWSAAARARNARFACAIHIDIGMNRLGLPGGELSDLCANPRDRLRDLNVVLWLGHLACGDDSDSPINALQRDRFRSALARLPPAPASLSASGGALLGKDYAFDLVRSGIGLYGGNPSRNRPNPFAVAAALTGRILQLRRVDSGETVGYGATFRTARRSTLATVGLGYADGLMRAIGNRGQGAIAGVRAPVVGRMSMDLVTLDVTDVPSDALSVGADVEFFGDSISLEEFAGWANTTNYEVLTSLGQRIPRRYEAPA